MEDRIFEVGCSEGWSSDKSEVNGECPDCGMPTVDGKAASTSPRIPAGGIPAC